jgi:predicted Fe-Mo cluster-binding NifX family protein
LEIIRLAVATNGNDGLEDFVSNVFGRAKTFTIIDFEDEKLQNVKTVTNTATSYSHGAGPIVVKMLEDNDVDMVLSNELGIGAAELLKQFKMTHIKVEPGTKVEEAIKNAFLIHRKEVSKK